MPIKRKDTSETEYIVVVDPMSTGATLAYHAQHHHGLRIMSSLSRGDANDRVRAAAGITVSVSVHWG